MATLEALTAMNPIVIAQSDATIIDPPLKFLAVFDVGGNIVVENAKGDEVTFVIPAAADGGGAPFVLPGRIRKVKATGTTIADAALIGYR